jgi:Tfp pilus assembly protein PilO
MNHILLEIFHQKKILLGVVLVLVLVNIVLSVAVSSYQLPALTATQTKWSDLRRQVALGSYADAASVYRQAAVDIEKLKSQIPPKREFARVLSDLIEMASSSAVSMGTMTYKPLPVTAEGLLPYQLSLSVNGGYAAVKSFLADLQKNPELVVVDSISLANSDLYVELVVMDLHITVYLREGA